MFIYEFIARLLKLNDDNLTVHIKTKKDVEDIENVKYTKNILII